MPRVILAVFLGYAFIRVLIFVADQLYAHFIPGVASDSYFGLAMATYTLFTLAGGWLCGLISRRDPRAVWGLIVFGEVMGVGSIVVVWNTAPHYYSFYLLIMYPLAVWYGARFVRSAVG